MDNKYFYCYSGPLKDFLNKHNLKYITKSVHEKTHKKYWVFEGSELLNGLLAEWRLKKN